jgi:hypothetical protein
MEAGPSEVERRALRPGPTSSQTEAGRVERSRDVAPDDHAVTQPDRHPIASPSSFSLGGLDRNDAAFAPDVRAVLQEQLVPLVRERTSPFAKQLDEAGAAYVEPMMPAEIRYLERTSGSRLRHAAFR